MRRDVTRGPGWSGLVNVGHALAQARIHACMYAHSCMWDTYAKHTSTNYPQTNTLELRTNICRDTCTLSDEVQTPYSNARVIKTVLIYFLAVRLTLN